MAQATGYCEGNTRRLFQTCSRASTPPGGSGRTRLVIIPGKVSVVAKFSVLYVSLNVSLRQPQRNVPWLDQVGGEEESAE